MNNKGFTLIEILAVLIVLALLMALSIPAYMSVFGDVKASNYHNKILEIEIAANKYGEKIKDEVKNSTGSCMTSNVSELIRKGYLVSEDDMDDVLYNPLNNQPLNSNVRICYCSSSFKIESFYLEPFNENTSYLTKTKVENAGKMYITTKDYNVTDLIKLEDKTNTKQRGINATYTEKSSINGTNVSKKYFNEIKC